MYITELIGRLEELRAEKGEVRVLAYHRGSLAPPRLEMGSFESLIDHNGRESLQPSLPEEPGSFESLVL
jgi:hypothetical protein